MEQQEYKILLERYYDGETSTSEESLLMDYLKTYDGNNNDLIEAKALFVELDKDSQEGVEINFSSIVNEKPKAKLKVLYGVVSGVAASLVIALSISFFVKSNNPPIVYAYVNGQAITNKHEAMQYSQQAISSIQANLNKGTQGLNYMNSLNKPADLLTVKN